MPNYWDTVLGENLYPNLYYYQFGTKRQIPRNFGTSIKIPRFRKKNIVAQLAGIPGASEGRIVGTSPAASDFISGTLKQFAGAYEHTDIVIMTALSDIIELSLRDIARDLAQDMDQHIEFQLSGVGQAVRGNNGATDGAVATAHSLRARDLLKSAVILDKNNNPRPPDGHYPAVLHPQQIFDLQTSLSANDWLEVNKSTSSSQTEMIYRGEMGRIFGTRIVTSTNNKQFLGTGISTGASGFRSYVLAPDSYYVTEISDMTAKTFVKQLGSGGTSDPVNQIATVGAKVFFTAIAANWTATEIRIARLLHGSPQL